ARAYLLEHQPTHERLLRQIRDTQADFQAWAEHLGNEPLRLFIDTTNPNTLLYLQMVMTHLLVVYTQDEQASTWLIEQDAKATSLFGTMRYGFSPALKEALHQEANALLNGLGDITNLATRAGELNAVLNHKDFADRPWMKNLKQPVRDTFKALRELAMGVGKATAETLLLAWVPTDSRLARGQYQNIAALIRNLLIGQILANTPERIRLNEQIASRLQQWKREWHRLSRQIAETRRRWLYPLEPHSRRSTARHLQTMMDALRLHELKLPMLLDFQNNQYARLLQDEIRAFFQSGLDVAKDWHTRAKAWSERLGGFSAAVTWGVILLNFINTALLYHDLTRDGDFSARDIVKVGYSLGYSANLLMAVFVEAPWAVIKEAKPVLIGGYDVGILDRSAAYWKAQGNPVWGEAVRSFRVTLGAVGAFAIVASTLEFWDIRGDYISARTSEEKVTLVIKGIAVLMMDAGGLAQLVGALGLSKQAIYIAMSPWFAVTLLIVGSIYLIASLALNYFKKDSIGWWLTKCCWSQSLEHRHNDNQGEEAEEKRSLLEIQLSPQIFIKRTTTHKQQYIGKGDYIAVAIQNGAWIQLLLPEAIRGQLIQLNVISSKRPFGPLSAVQKEDHLTELFEERGEFISLNQFGKLGNERPSYMPSHQSSPINPMEKDIVWQVWVPLNEDVDYIELQIWYSTRKNTSELEIHSYLYQLELTNQGQMTADGSTFTNLEVSKTPRKNALTLVIPE
ncbi:hypothetical protein ACIPY9_17450, partial [Pseudomonas sp. NPDC089734]